MAWVRIHDGAMQNLKITALSDSAFRLWIRGLCYCQTALTDGLIPRTALKEMGARRRDVDMLSTSPLPGRAPLWEHHDIGFKVHDYLIWNDCREKVVERQDKARIRKVFFTDHELRDRLRDRDGDACRYCGDAVTWTDRRGPKGATYDHVDPTRPYDDFDNLVVACRGCNSKKRNRTPEVANMTLLPPGKPRSNQGRIKTLNQTKPNQTKPVLPTEEQTQRFEDFWAAYPKHEGRKAALKWWLTTNPDAAFAETIRLGAQRYAIKARGVEPRYVKQPLTWLNGAHWEDAGPKPALAAYDWECDHEPHCGNRTTCAVVSMRKTG